MVLIIVDIDLRKNRFQSKGNVTVDERFAVWFRLSLLLILESKRSLMTVVFTDAAGFTVLARENEPLALQLLSESHDVFQEVFSRHRGEVIKSTGDGTLSVFPSAADAIIACLEAQERLKDSKLKHRIGVEAGEVTIRNSDVYGDAVNTAARLEQEAIPGQIWTTRAVFEIVRAQSLPPAKYIGPRILKGIPEPVAIHAWGEGVKPARAKSTRGNFILILSSILVLAAVIPLLLLTIKSLENRSPAVRSWIQRPTTSKQYSEGEDIDALMDEAFVQVMDEMEAYEEVKKEARAKLDATPVIEFLASSPLGKRERGQRELEHWSLVQMAIEKGRIAAGQKASASEIINSLSKSKDSTVKLALKAFDDEF
jgi:class 3 adenylate cyclase